MVGYVFQRTVKSAVPFASLKRKYTYELEKERRNNTAAPVLTTDAFAQLLSPSK
jgi:hypothetical protein